MTRQSYVSGLFGLVLLSAFSPGRVWAACNCPSSTSGSYCTGNSIAVSSGVGGPPADTITIDFASAYQCGQYANGDFWVVGEGSPKTVRVTAAAPSWDGSRHGWMANSPIGQQRLDNRIPEFAGAPPSLPQSFGVESGPVTFVKAIGRNTTSTTAYRCDTQDSLRESCVKFDVAVTFVSAPPDSDGDGSTADEFRPGPFGSSKLGPFRVDMLESRAQSMPRLPASAVPHRDDFSFREIRDRYACAYLYHYGSVMQQITATDCLMRGSAPTNGQLTYGNNIAVNNRVAPLRFLLDDFRWSDPVARQALINFVQHGIDLAQMVHSGWRTRAASKPIGNDYLSPGGIMIGHKSPVVFAAFMIRHPTLTAIAAGNHYFESDQVYRSSVDGRVYYGVGIQGTNPYCPDDGTGFEKGIHCYHPSKQIDAGCASSAGGYQSQVSNSAPYDWLWVDKLGARTFWADDAWLEFARAWRAGGRAPGHTQYLWSNGRTSCDNTRRNLGYETPFADEMWSAFHATPAPPPAPPPPAPLPAPTQLP